MKLFFCLLGIAFFYKALTGVDLLSEEDVLNFSAGIVLFKYFVNKFFIITLKIEPTKK